MNNYILRFIVLILGAWAVSLLMAQSKHWPSSEYYSVYDVGLKCPTMVVWSLAPTDMGRAKRKSSWQFFGIPSDTTFKASTYDYVQSGYHRGHLCPAADRSSTLGDMYQTFRLDNVCPQWPSVNTGSWLATEEWCRQWVRLHQDSLTVVAIPVFLPRDTVRIGVHRLAVPHAFFKAAFLSRDDSVLRSWFIFNHK